MARAQPFEARKAARRRLARGVVRQAARRTSVTGAKNPLGGQAAEAARRPAFAREAKAVAEAAVAPRWAWAKRAAAPERRAVPESGASAAEAAGAAAAHRALHRPPAVRSLSLRPRPRVAGRAARQTPPRARGTSPPAASVGLGRRMRACFAESRPPQSCAGPRRCSTDPSVSRSVGGSTTRQQRPASSHSPLAAPGRWASPAPGSNRFGQPRNMKERDYHECVAAGGHRKLRWCRAVAGEGRSAR